MSTPLIPQEIYLLERYSSLEYFGEMRDAWAQVVAVVDEVLEHFSAKLPADLRKRHLSEQYDIVWGERVQPNFRNTLQGLNQGYIRLSHGDLSALGGASSVRNASIGQGRDYMTDWMPSELEERFYHWMHIANVHARTIYFTESGWYKGSLVADYSSDSFGPLNPPQSWPQYRLRPEVQLKTGDIVTRSGIYLPACDDGVAVLQIEGYEVLTAYVGRDPVTTHAVREEATTWTLVERIADSGGGVPGAPDPVLAGIILRVEAGQPCTREGYWFTPSKANSRRRFTVGEQMPEIGSDYGATIWQWDVEQSPKPEVLRP